MVFREEKAHTGADRDSGMVHTVISTAASVSDISQAADLLHGSETQVHADAGYVGGEKREEVKAEDPTARIDWQVAKRRGRIKKREDGPEKDRVLAAEKATASVRAFCGASISYPQKPLPTPKDTLPRVGQRSPSIPSPLWVGQPRARISTTGLIEGLPSIRNFQTAPNHATSPRNRPPIVPRPSPLRSLRE